MTKEDNSITTSHTSTRHVAFPAVARPSTIELGLKRKEAAVVEGE